MEQRIDMLEREVGAIKADRLELGLVKEEHPAFATKVDLFQLELRLKTWIVGSIFSALTLMTALQIGLYNAFVR